MIVVEKGIVAFLTTSIHDQPWKPALNSILERMGLDAAEDSAGVITVKKREPPECASGSPVFIIDGVMQGTPCGHRAASDSTTWYTYMRKPN